MSGFAKTQVPASDTPVSAPPVSSDELSLTLLLRLAAAAALIATLLSSTACGGGGGSDASAPPPPPSPAPAPAPAPTMPIAAQLSVPTPAGYDADRLAAFNRLNEIRLAAGLGMLAQSTAMDQAAQAHAAWMTANDSFTHEEVAGTVGFTGTNWARRDEAFGYVPLSGAEVMVAGAHGAAAVDELINTVYHRAALLAFEPVDVGVGASDASAAGFSRPLVIDLTRPGTDATRGLGQAPQAHIGGVAVWPLDGARDVPLRLGLETPNPVPTQEVTTLGTPASIVVGEIRTMSTTSFTMTRVADDVAVPLQVLTSQTDPNLSLPASFVAAVPLASLAPNTTYRVAFSGSARDRLSGVVEVIDRSWTFTTASRPVGAQRSGGQLLNAPARR